MNYFTCEQVAEIAKCSVYCVREAIKNGKIKAFKPGKQYVITQEGVEAWIKSCAVSKKS